jgi:hypothetical protein
VFVPSRVNGPGFGASTRRMRVIALVKGNG